MHHLLKSDLDRGLFGAKYQSECTQLHPLLSDTPE